MIDTEREHEKKKGKGKGERGERSWLKGVFGD
jgi:hypothetical protein